MWAVKFRQMGVIYLNSISVPVSAQYPRAMNRGRGIVTGQFELDELIALLQKDVLLVQKVIQARDLYGDKSEYTAAKERLPFMTPHVQYIAAEARIKRSLGQQFVFSGMVMLDWDDPNLDKHQVLADPYTYRCMATPSGKLHSYHLLSGLPETVPEFTTAYQQVAKYYSDKYNVDYDPLVSNYNTLDYLTPVWKSGAGQPYPVNYRTIPKDRTKRKVLVGKKVMPRTRPLNSDTADDYETILSLLARSEPDRAGCPLGRHRSDNRELMISPPERNGQLPFLYCNRCRGAGYDPIVSKEVFEHFGLPLPNAKVNERLFRFRNK